MLSFNLVLLVLPENDADSRLHNSLAGSSRIRLVPTLLSTVSVNARPAMSPQVVSLSTSCPSIGARNMSSRPSHLPSASFHSPSRPSPVLHPSRDAFSASFSTTQPLQRLRDRQLPVFQAFCKYLSAHDVSQATHRAAVWKAFKETAPPAVVSVGPISILTFSLADSSPAYSPTDAQSDHFIYIRDHSDIIYRYRDQLERHFPQFMALRSYPPTTSMRGRKRLNPRPEDSIHDKIYEAFRQFLRAYDWRKPVRRGGLFLEFQGTTTGSIVSSPQALAKQNVDAAPYWVMDVCPALSLVIAAAQLTPAQTPGRSAVILEEL